MKEYAGVHSQLLRLKPILSQRFGVDRIGYFDCFLDQHHNQDCELNILVILEKPLGWEFFELKEFLQKKLQTRIDICTPKALKPALREEIMNQTRFV
jgi:uncharacterized protein